jgi:hypothetical protein
LKGRTGRERRTEPTVLNTSFCLLDHPRIVPVREAQWDPEGDRAISFVNPDRLSGASG